MPPDADALATLVVHTIQKTLTPVLERLAAAEARLAAIGDVRDRVVAIETKSTDLAPIVERLTKVEQKKTASMEALGPWLERVTAAETRLETLGDVRERVIVMETKAAQPVSEPRLDLGPVCERLATLEARLAILPSFDVSIEALEKDLGTIRERIAVVETRPLLPGPPGPPGEPGRDGINGKDGTAGLSYEGVYQDGQTYEKGQIATWGGSSWHANTTTTAKPGESSKDWTLMVKRGRDGKDGVNGRDAAMPVVKAGA